MLKIGPKYIKIKTDLRLAITRLKILQAKKSELAEKIRKEISLCLLEEKFMKAKIKVQTVLRYEASVETMEIVEMFCEQILERFGVFEEKKEMDPCLIQAVASLIWVTPYLQSEVKELKGIIKQFSVKYGVNFVRSALKNKKKTVNVDLIQKVKVLNSPDKIVHQCLLKIAEKYEVPKKTIEALSNCFSNEQDREKPNSAKYYNKSSSKSSVGEIFGKTILSPKAKKIEMNKFSNEIDDDALKNETKYIQTGKASPNSAEIKVPKQNFENKISRSISDFYDLKTSDNIKLNSNLKKEDCNRFHDELYPQKKQVSFSDYENVSSKSDSNIEGEKSIYRSSGKNEIHMPCNPCEQCVEELPPSYSSVVYVTIPENSHVTSGSCTLVAPSCPLEESNDF